MVEEGAPDTSKTKADWQYDSEYDMHIPCCTMVVKWPDGRYRRCGNGPLTGEQVRTGICGEHQ